MKPLCCPGCRLRFTRFAATYVTACPECGLPLKPVDGSESLIGFRLLGPQDTPHLMPEAMVVALSVPGATARDKPNRLDRAAAVSTDRS